MIQPIGATAVLNIKLRSKIAIAFHFFAIIAGKIDPDMELLMR